VIYKEIRTRSIAKATSHRILGTLTTTLIAFFFTGQLAIALTIGGVEIISKLFIYYFHERIWDKISFGKKRCQPAVLWFTGLPCSGKTTTAKEVYKTLKKRSLPVEHLDGDTIRNLFPNTGFSKGARDSHIQRVGYLASKLEQHGVFVIASFISPYEETRRFVRQLCHNFVEIYLSTPLEICEARDIKGLYKQAREGSIKWYTGISDPYEVPTNPEIEIDTSKISLETAVEQIVNYLEKHFMRKLTREKKPREKELSQIPITSVVE